MRGRFSIRGAPIGALQGWVMQRGQCGWAALRGVDMYVESFGLHAGA